MVQAAKRAVAFSVTLVALVTAVIMTTLKFGPSIEGSVYPVYVDLKYSFVKIEGNHMDIIVTGVKNRECLLNSYSAMVARNDTVMSAQAQFLKQDGTPLSKEEQRIGKGDKFVRIVRVTPISTHVDIDITAQCHPFWQTPQRMLSLDINASR